MQITNPRRAAAAAERTLGLDAGSPLSTTEPTVRVDSSTSTAGRSRPGGGPPAAEASLASASTRGASRLPAADGRLAGARLRRHRRRTASPGSSWRSTNSSPAVPGQETVVKDPSGSVIEVSQQRSEIPGKDVFLTLDHTIQANAEEVLRPDRSRGGTQRAPAPSCWIRAPGRSSPWPCNPATTPIAIPMPRATYSATAPSPTRTSRARRQARNGRRCAVGEARLALHAVHAPVPASRRRPRHP